MPRYRATIEYDGGPYKGFQLQAALPTVQGALEAAILGFSGEAARVHAAGRTDTGVHATGQVVHFDLEREWRAEVVRDAANAHLVREAVVVLEAERVLEDFHARFSAVGRRYLFRILDRKAPPAIERGRVWWVKAPLDAEAMHAAGQALVGLHDFTTFRDANCQSASPVKTLDAVAVERRGDEVRLSFAARSFLHRQVRSMTGALAEVGMGRWSAADLVAALEARDRKACAPVAPPQGLYLSAVVYPAAETAKAKPAT
ncbi:MAG TPA: tRNA pseudouridine(38-40) synthase TruA [Caulobacteraceae bacterium]|jgi:tRNA pseudouridine38-40 synthase|nr:tRNA pseudouridine(38-40) synthase TruA [Caulobacteraceae bacterium]